MIHGRAVQVLVKTVMIFSVTEAVLFFSFNNYFAFFRHGNASLFNFHLHLCDY